MLTANSHTHTVAKQAIATGLAMAYAYFEMNYIF